MWLKTSAPGRVLFDAILFVDTVDIGTGFKLNFHTAAGIQNSETIYTSAALAVAAFDALTSSPKGT